MRPGIAHDLGAVERTPSSGCAKTRSSSGITGWRFESSSAQSARSAAPRTADARLRRTGRVNRRVRALGPPSQQGPVEAPAAQLRPARRRLRRADRPPRAARNVTLGAGRFRPPTGTSTGRSRRPRRETACDRPDVGACALPALLACVHQRRSALRPRRARCLRTSSRSPRTASAVVGGSRTMRSTNRRMWWLDECDVPPHRRLRLHPHVPRGVARIRPAERPPPSSTTAPPACRFRHDLRADLAHRDHAFAAASVRLAARRSLHRRARPPYDTAAFHDRFLARWPAGSLAHASYFRRITDGPEYRIASARRVPRFRSS